MQTQLEQSLLAKEHEYATNTPDGAHGGMIDGLTAEVENLKVWFAPYKMIKISLPTL